MPRIANAPFWFASLVYAYAVYALSTLFVTTALRCVAAIVVAGAAYVLLLLPITLAWQPDSHHAATVYAFGMALATMGGTGVANLIFPRHTRQIGMLACVGLSMAFPVLLAVLSGPEAPVRAMQWLYVAATIAGGCAAVGMLSRDANRPIWLRYPSNG